jgi:hypothetical protein
MKKQIKALFPDIDREISIELDDSRSPKTVQAILERLPSKLTLLNGEMNCIPKEPKFWQMKKTLKER